MAMPLDKPQLKLSDGSLALASELAAELSDPLVVAERHGLDEVSLRRLLKDKRFQQLVRDARKAWGADGNVRSRIRAKSAMMIEDILLVLHAKMNDPDTSINQLLELVKLVAQLGKVDGGERALTPEATGAGGWQLTIQIGEATTNFQRNIEKEINPQPAVAEG